MSGSAHVFLLFLRSRMAGWGALGVIAVVGVFFGVGVVRNVGEDAVTLAAVVVPLIPALIILTTARSPFGEVEWAASRSLPALRIGQIAGMTLLAGGGLALATTSWTGDGLRLLLLRNLVGLLGMGLLTALAVGVSLAWLTPSLAAFLAVVTTHDEFATIDYNLLWSWPARADGDWRALLFVAGIALVAIALHARYGTRDPLDETV
jgi:hypothetical protein